MRKRCPNCNGIGRVSGLECGWCSGTGEVEVEIAPAPRPLDEPLPEPLCICGDLLSCHLGDDGRCAWCGGCKKFEEDTATGGGPSSVDPRI